MKAVARCTLRVARLFLLITPAAPALAQLPPRDTVRLAEIVVTPTRTATPRSSVAAAITVLDGERLRAQGVTSVADALREVVGASVVQPGSDGALTSLFLRGGESDYTSVLVDGVALNDPGGAINLADLTLDNVERIEVVRGPASVLYGSDAVSGVVQIFTRRGRGPARAETAFESGWFDGLTPGGLGAPRSGLGRTLERWRAGVAGGSDAVGDSFSLSRAGTARLYAAPAFDNSYCNTAASGSLRAQPDAVTDASLTVRYGDHLFHYPTDGAGRLAPFSGRGERARLAGRDAGAQLVAGRARLGRQQLGPGLERGRPEVGERGGRGTESQIADHVVRGGDCLVPAELPQHDPGLDQLHLSGRHVLLKRPRP